MSLHGGQEQPRSDTAPKLMLVFGNYDYQKWNQLRSPKEDAEQIRKLFEAQGFTAFGPAPPAIAETKDFQRAMKALQEASQKRKIQDLIVYYAGHGIDKIPLGSLAGSTVTKAYLVPLTAKSDDPAEKLIGIEDDLIGGLAKVNAQHIFVIVDACSAGLAVQNLTQSGDQGPGIFLLTSATGDRKAYDNSGISAFTGSLIASIRDRKCDWNFVAACTSSDIAAYVQVAMANSTHGFQIPALVRIGANEEIRFSLDIAEARDWREVKQKDDPDSIRKFLNDHPSGGTYVDVARSKLIALESDLLLKGKLRTLSVADYPAPGTPRLDPGVPIYNLIDLLYYVWIRPPDNTHGNNGGFWMGSTEVPVYAFKKFRGGTIGIRAPVFNPGWKKNTGQPMVNVSWHDAQDYCKNAGGALPTAEQWEKAAGSKQTTKTTEHIYNLADAWAEPWAYWDEDQKTRTPFHQAQRTDLPACPPEDHCPSGMKDLLQYNPSPLPVGLLGFDVGLSDMIGNVAEWTRDNAGATGEDSARKKIRGGSFADRWSPDSYYESSAQQIGDNRIGFRCVVVPKLNEMEARK